MTLAVAILLLAISAVPPASSGPRVSLAQSTDSGSGKAITQSQTPAGHTEAPDQKAESGQQPPVQSPAKPKVGTRKKRSYRKKVVAADCAAAPTTADPPSLNTTNSPQPESAQGQVGSTPEASKNCPPPKIIVHQGGITEQSIQLAGGARTAQDTQKRDAANQMLATTDANLKKIASLQLTAAQQDSVSQIRQFVDQSKTALAAGDLERAHTLAWKAQVLSEDLLKPKK